VRKQYLLSPKRDEPARGFLDACAVAPAWMLEQRPAVTRFGGLHWVCPVTLELIAAKSRNAKALEPFRTR